MKKIICLVIAYSLVFTPLSILFSCTVEAKVVSASSVLSRQQAIDFVKKAQKNQWTLTEKDYFPLSKVKSTMNPYFTSAYINEFVNAGGKNTKSGWISNLRGTDDVTGYLPYDTPGKEMTASYSKDKKKIYVTGYANSEGDIYKVTTTLVKTKVGWRIEAIKWL